MGGLGRDEVSQKQFKEIMPKEYAEILSDNKTFEAGGTDYGWAASPDNPMGELYAAQAIKSDLGGEREIFLEQAALMPWIEKR